MNRKTLTKLVNLGQYKMIEHKDTEYYVSNHSLGPMTWLEAQEYTPLSKEEFELLHKEIEIVDTRMYWSSSEYVTTNAWFFTFNYGYIYLNDKSNALYVRCVRRFKI